MKRKKGLDPLDQGEGVPGRSSLMLSRTGQGQGQQVDGRGAVEKLGEQFMKLFYGRRNQNRPRTRRR